MVRVSATRVVRHIQEKQRHLVKSTRNLEPLQMRVAGAGCSNQEIRFGQTAFRQLLLVTKHRTQNTARIRKQVTRKTFTLSAFTKLNRNLSRSADRSIVFRTN